MAKIPNPVERALADARAAVADGEAVVARALEEMRHKKAPLAEVLADKPVPDANIGGMITSVIEAEAKGRWITAAGGLVCLRQYLEHARHYDAEDWAAFVVATFPFSVQRADELMGRMVHRKDMLQCTKCGTEVVCPCGCGTVYAPTHRWAKPVAAKPPTALERAMDAVKATPEKSDRVIAKALSIGATTVRDARKRLTNDRAPDRAPDRVGADGKHYPARRESKNDHWQVLPPDGQTDCDYNPEFEKAFADESDAEFRRNAVNWQLFDIERMLTKDFALLRPGTAPREITKALRKRVRSIKRMVDTLDDQLGQRSRRV